MASIHVPASSLICDPSGPGMGARSRQGSQVQGWEPGPGRRARPGQSRGSVGSQDPAYRQIGMGCCKARATSGWAGF